MRAAAAKADCVRFPNKRQQSRSVCQAFPCFVPRCCIWTKTYPNQGLFTYRRVSLPASQPVAPPVAIWQGLPRPKKKAQEGGSIFMPTPSPLLLAIPTPRCNGNENNLRISGKYFLLDSFISMIEALDRRASKSNFAEGCVRKPGVYFSPEGNSCAPYLLSAHDRYVG